MRAAAAGKSTLGIPKKVGQEFSKADPGGKLPKIKPKEGRRNYQKGGIVDDRQLKFGLYADDIERTLGVKRGYAGGGAVDTDDLWIGRAATVTDPELLRMYKKAKGG